MILLITTLVFILVLIPTLIGYFYLESVETLQVGFIILFFIGFVGYFILGTSIPVDEECKEIKNFDIAQTKSKTLIDTGSRYIVTDDSALWDTDKSDIEVYKVEKYDSYGKILEEKTEIMYEIKNDED